MPETLDEQLAWMVLGKSRLAPRWWRSAIAKLGCARVLIDASDRALADVGLTALGIAALRRARPDIERVRDDCARLDISIAEHPSDAYPPLLREIADPPAVLYFRGPPPAAAPAMVAVVGSRRATRYGRRIAARIAGELAAAGATVVSGLAYGIDACAHDGALRFGLSAGVLARGLDRPYPHGNRRLFDALVTSAGVSSEYPPETPTERFRFPERNRIVTGMSRATVIVEAAERSGSLVSARLALEQGRELFVVPGNIDSPMSRGTNGLLRDGCAPLLETSDVLEALGLRRATQADPVQAPCLQDAEARRVFAALESEPAHIDDVVQASGLDGARVLELLTTLELAGLVERVAGGHFARANAESVFCKGPA